MSEEIEATTDTHYFHEAVTSGVLHLSESMDWSACGFVEVYSEGKRTASKRKVCKNCLRRTDLWQPTPAQETQR
jgi:hypothetical protein